MKLMLTKMIFRLIYFSDSKNIIQRNMQRENNQEEAS